jgi:hypothetical protein
MASPSYKEDHHRTEQQLSDGAAAAAYVRSINTVQADVMRANDQGNMKGKCCIVRLLNFTQYTTTFLVPFMHTVFRGVVWDFFSWPSLVHSSSSNSWMAPWKLSVLLMMASQLQLVSSCCQVLFVMT